MVDGIEAEFPDVQVFRLDYAESSDQEAARALRLVHHPSLLVIDADGEAGERILGPPDEEALRAEVAGVVE